MQCGLMPDISLHSSGKAQASAPSGVMEHGSTGDTSKANETMPGIVNPDTFPMGDIRGPKIGGTLQRLAVNPTGGSDA